MGLVYPVPIDNGAIAAASGDYDIFSFAPVANKPIKVIGYELDVLTELGDAQEEHLRLVWIRGYTAQGSAGSGALTLVPLGSNSGPNQGFVAHTLDATVASGGTQKNLIPTGFNVRAGYSRDYDDEIAPRCTAADSTLVLRLMAAVADDLNISGTCWVEEEGNG